MSLRFLALCAVIAGGLIAAPAVRAQQLADASCGPVATAFLKMASAPRYRSVIAMGAPGHTQQAERIVVGDTTYYGGAGHWLKKTAALSERLQADREIGMRLTGCRSVRSDNVAGEGVQVYAAHSASTSPVTRSDMEVWISKSRGFPVRVDSDASFNGGAPTHSTETITYGGDIRPPA